MDAGEGLPGRWGPADAARPAPRPLPARPGRGAAVGGVWPRAERAGRRLRGGRLGSDSPVFAGLALLRFARGTRVTGLAGPRPAGTGRGSAAPGAGAGARAARVPKRRPWELLPPPRSERRGKRFPFCGVLWVGWSQDTCSALPAPLVRGLTAGATPGWCFCGRAWEPQPARRPELPGSRGRAGRGRGSAGAAGSPLGSAGGRVGSASRGPGASPRAAASVGPAGPGKGAAPGPLAAATLPAAAARLLRSPFGNKSTCGQHSSDLGVSSLTGWVAGGTGAPTPRGACYPRGFFCVKFL